MLLSNSNLSKYCILLKKMEFIREMAIKKHPLKNCCWRYVPWFSFMPFILMINFPKTQHQKENSSLLKISHFPFLLEWDVYLPLFIHTHTHLFVFFLSWFACQELGVNSIFNYFQSLILGLILCFFILFPLTSQKGSSVEKSSAWI